MVSDLQGSARRHDPRTRRQGKDAGQRFERAYKLDDSMLRVADEYARWSTRNKDAAAATRSTKPSTRSCRGIRWCWKASASQGRQEKQPLVDSAQAGAAEALYGIGATLTRAAAKIWRCLSAVALYLQPNHPLARSLADLYESVKSRRWRSDL